MLVLWLGLSDFSGLVLEIGGLGMINCKICNRYFKVCSNFKVNSCFIFQAKNFNVPGSQGRWPKKSAEVLLQLLKNAESNAELKVGCKKLILLITII